MSRVYEKILITQQKQTVQLKIEQRTWIISWIR